MQPPEKIQEAPLIQRIHVENLKKDDKNEESKEEKKRKSLDNLSPKFNKETE